MSANLKEDILRYSMMERLERLERREARCKHMYEVFKRSNVIQQDMMGYPLRLCIMQCLKCGKTEQQWLDVNESALKELKTGESVLLEWKT